MVTIPTLAEIINVGIVPKLSLEKIKFVTPRGVVSHLKSFELCPSPSCFWLKGYICTFKIVYIVLAGETFAGL